LRSDENAAHHASTCSSAKFRPTDTQVPYLGGARRDDHFGHSSTPKQEGCAKHAAVASGLTAGKSDPEA
jgi:hypothetical protein